MNIITLDFETYFDKDYSLKKMSVEKYVRDPRFEAHGCAMRINDTTQWVDAKTFKQWFVNCNWQDYAVLCHHTQFDGLILAHHYGVRPKLWLDTLSMARAVIGTHVLVSLNSLAKHFNLEAKRVPYYSGIHWNGMNAVEKALLADGCCHDVDLTWNIFQWLMPQLPPSELLLIDRTIRMFTEPALVGDIALFDRIAEQESQKKETQRAALAVTEEELHSAAKFAALLEDEGIELAYKDGKNGPIPALGKNDEFMKELLQDESERVRGLVECRLSAKSTLVESRARTFADMSRRGLLCVYYRYFAAHTSRWGGGDKTNFQNLRRGHDLRRGIIAPDGTQLVIVDLSQIECRILNLLAGQMDVIERFRNGEDPYITLASAIYQRPITKADVMERGTGKQGELSCGYGCGWKKFKATAAAGTYGPPVDMTELAARRAVTIYRATHQWVVQLWQQAEVLLQYLTDPRYEAMQWGPMLVANQHIKLPNGLTLNYDTLEEKVSEGGWRMWHLQTTQHGRTKIYGAKLIENVVQALARVVFSDALLRVPEYKLVMMSHDEAVFLVDAAAVAGAVPVIRAAFEKPPKWLSDLPVGCEIHVATRYSK